MTTRLCLETLTKSDEEVLLRWQFVKSRYDGMELFGLHDQGTRDAYFDALADLNFEDPELAALGVKATTENGEAARLNLVELSLEIEDLFPSLSRKIN